MYQDVVEYSGAKKVGEVIHARKLAKEVGEVVLVGHNHDHGGWCDKRAFRVWVRS